MITNKWQQTGATTITQAAPGKAGQKLVLTSINIISTAACTITVQSPSGTTVWQTQIFNPGGGYTDRWTEETGIRGAENQAMIIAVSAGTYTISVTGVTVE